MKLFGEYLVEKKLIQAEQLLDALITQIEEQPSVPKLARELGLLDSSQLLQILRHQTLKQCSFLEAASSLSLWNATKMTTLTNEIAGRRTPLGEILVREKILDIKSLTRALDDFFGGLGKETKATSPATQSVAQSSGAEFISDEIFEYLSPIFNHFSAVAESLSSGKILSHEPLLALANSLHKIMSASKLYDFEDLAAFIERSENGLREVTARKPELLNADVTRKVLGTTTTLRGIFEKLTALRTTGGIPGDLFRKPEIMASVQSVSDGFTLIEFDISHLPKEVLP